MRIAIDARELHGRPTGVGRFLNELLTAWRHLPEAAAHEFIPCAPDAERAGTAWEQLVLPRLIRESKADVLFAPAYTSPLRAGVPVVLVVHDVSFAAHPEWFSWREGARRRTLTRLAAARAHRVITVSEFSKREISAHLAIDPSRIEVVYHGLTRIPRVEETGNSTRSTVLYAGSLFNRRHIPEVIEGFARAAARHSAIELQVVGENRTAPYIDIDALARASGAGARIHVRSYLPDAELHRLYGSAAAFVFLSDYEGFGLTPLEALGAGVPIVVLDNELSREVYGEAAVYVARPEPSAIAAALESVLFDGQTRTRVLAAAASVLQRYSWDTAARRVLQALTAAGGDLVVRRAAL